MKITIFFFIYLDFLSSLIVVNSEIVENSEVWKSFLLNIALVQEIDLDHAFCQVLLTFFSQ